MKTKILTLLKIAQETDSYLSGQEICNQLGVSRTAIWKVMNQLKEEGYQIEAVQNKGYRLIDTPDTISQWEIGSLLQTEWLGKEILYSEETGSTNNDAKWKAEEGCQNGALVVTNWQKSGRGRRGREWEMEQGNNIAMSLVLRPTFSPNKASMLTLVMALSVAKVLNSHTDLTCQIKWPNDVLVNGKKVCGILTEMSAELDYVHYIVVGVGINVNSTQFPEELMDKATSLYQEGKHVFNRSQLISSILKQFEKDYEVFCRSLDLSAFIEDYHKYLVNKDVPVKILDPNGDWEGIAKGINESGELLVINQDMETIAVYAGEVSVRGMNGYI